MSANGTHNGSTGDQLVGRVLSVNERGLRLEGREDWLNVSKWATDVTLPQRGACVTVTLDTSGFICSIDQAAAASTNVLAAAGPSKDTTITHLAVLEAVAGFAASRPGLKSADLLALAERMEAWVTRD